MKCDFPPGVGYVYCRICGRRAKRTVPEKMPVAECYGQPGWGDRLAVAIARTMRILFPSKNVGGCGGCKRRQEKLNRFGRWVTSLWPLKVIPPNHPQRPDGVADNEQHPA
jgi:hypothetical protein